MGRKKAKLAKKKTSDNLRTSIRSSDQIPLDLIRNILKALPVKTLASFVCISKQFASIIRNKYFKKSYVMKSSTRLQSLFFTFDVNCYKKHCFFSASHDLKNGGESSSSFATYHMNCHHAEPYTTVAPSVHGLICYGPPNNLMVYKPNTRRSHTLLVIDSMRLYMLHYLGYDLIDGDYKVLCMMKDGRGLAQVLRVLTLGNGNPWRMIQDCPPHSPQSLEICIKGMLYYEAYRSFQNNYQAEAVMSFDVRSEKFDLIRLLLISDPAP